MAKSKRRHHVGDQPGGASASGNGAADREGNRSDRIAARAYELYLARGGSDGQAWDDWLEAERELSQSQDDRGE